MNNPPLENQPSSSPPQTLGQYPLQSLGQFEQNLGRHQPEQFDTEPENGEEGE